MQVSNIKDQKLPASKTGEVATPVVPNSSTKKSSKSDSEPETMADLLSQTGYHLTSFKRGEQVKAKVLEISPKKILLDIGGKSEAVVHEKEVPYIGDLAQSLKVGDMITAQVVVIENDRGQTVVSLRKTASTKRWQLLSEKMKKGEMVDVTIRELSRGGFLVDYFGLRGFIPLSQVDAELVRSGDRASGRRVSVKIIEVDESANRLVFSQTSGQVNPRQAAALKQIKVGQTCSAEVTGLAPFGAFVGVKVGEESLPGLIHISEIAWEKVEKTEDYIKMGQTLDVKIIGIDAKSGKLTLSLKQLQADPWQDVVKMFSIDQTVKGTVARVTPIGVFVTLLPAIEGLIHISKLAPGEEPKVGEEVECTIEEINPDKRKISLSLVTHAKPIGYR